MTSPQPTWRWSLGQAHTGPTHFPLENEKGHTGTTASTDTQNWILFDDGLLVLFCTKMSYFDT